MKIVRIMGGLGNQMFQYAFGRAIGHETLFDLSWFDDLNVRSQSTPRSCELQKFNLKLSVASKNEIDILLTNNRLTKFLKYIRKLFHCPYYKIKQIQEPDLCFHKDLMHISGNVYYTGYFQSEKYFWHIREQLLQDFSLQVQMNKENIELLKQILSCNAVSLHVRRGDYVNLQHIYYVNDLKYYNNAISYLVSKEKNIHFFLFSDDMDWVKKNLIIPYPTTYVDVNDSNMAVFDMELMKHCKHNIIANSTFSWWGAWLNENPNKIVIAPQYWYSNGMKTDIIPAKWIKI